MSNDAKPYTVEEAQRIAMDEPEVPEPVAGCVVGCARFVATAERAAQLDAVKAELVEENREKGKAWREVAELKRVAAAAEQKVKELEEREALSAAMLSMLVFECQDERGHPIAPSDSALERAVDAIEKHGQTKAACDELTARVAADFRSRLSDTEIGAAAERARIREGLAALDGQHIIASAASPAYTDPNWIRRASALALVEKP